MRTLNRVVAATELLLIFPAVLFMTSLFARNVQPQQYEPAHTAQRIVEWYSVRPRIGLWVLLMALPFAVLVVGCGTLLRNWSADGDLRRAAVRVVEAIRGHLAVVLMAAATAAAAAILGVVAVHVLTD